MKNLRHVAAAVLSALTLSTTAAASDYEFYVLACNTGRCHRGDSFIVGGSRPDYQANGVAMRMEAPNAGDRPGAVRLLLDIAPAQFPPLTVRGDERTGLAHISLQLEPRSLRYGHFTPLAVVTGTTRITYQLWGRLAGAPPMPEPVALR